VREGLLRSCYLLL